jgi:hypothetical protein
VLRKASSHGTDLFASLSRGRRNIHARIDGGKQEKSIFCCLLLFCLPVCAFAQGSGPGFPVTSPQDCIGGVCVNLQSLSVSVVVPVMSKSGAFPFNFSFAGNFYMIEGGGGWEPSIMFAAGQFTQSASGIGTVPGYSTPTSTTCPGGSPATVKYTNWFVQDSTGTRHPLPSNVYADSQGCLSGSGFTTQTIDGSGYTATVTASGGDGGIETGGGALISDIGVTDSNGNSITLAPSTGIYTDTLGLTVLTYSTTSSTQKAAWTDVTCPIFCTSRCESLHHSQRLWARVDSWAISQRCRWPVAE